MGLEKIKWFLFLIMVPMLWESSAVASSANEVKPGGKYERSVLTIVQEDKGKSFEVHLDDAIVIRLPENPTTGYRWAIDKVDEKLLELQESDFTPPSEPRLGAGGWRTLTFKAKSIGTSHIQLKHWREWEGDDSIIERFDVTIRIRS